MTLWKDKDQDRGRVFTRRAALLAGGKLLLVSTHVGSMYYLQIVESAKYQKLDSRLEKTPFDPAVPYFLDEPGAVQTITGRKK